MSRFPRRRAALFAAILFATVTGRAFAADPLPPELRKVPRDAAVFIHLDAAALWSSKLGENVRAITAEPVVKFFEEAKTLGLTPDMLKTVNVCFPQFRGPGDERTVAFQVTFSKPYDRVKIFEFMKAQKLEPVEVTNGHYVVVMSPKPGTEKIDESNRIHFVLTDPMRAEIFIGLDSKFHKDRPATETGPQDAALKAAAEGTTGVLGVNFLNLPDEIRGDEVPPEVRPFQPLFRSDLLLARAKLVKDDLQLEVRFRNKDKAKTMDAEKSLAAGVTLIQLAIGAAILELEKAKEKRPDNPEVAFLPLIKKVTEAMKSAKVSVEETEAIATVTAPIDLPIAPLAQELFGMSGPRTAASRANAQNNLKQIGLALHNYHDAYNSFPPSAILDKKGKPMLSWRVMILPYIEQQDLYQKFKLDEPWDSAHNKKVLDENPMPAVFRVPGVTMPTDKKTPVQVFYGEGAMFDLVLGGKFTQITDGTSNTIMAVHAAKAVTWTAPEDLAFDPKADPTKLLLYPDMKGTSVLFGDGSVRYLQKTIKPDTLRAYITKSGGEVINDDE